MILSQLVNALRRQSFQPNILSLFINPFFFIRKGLYKHIKHKNNYLHGEMLDFGCGRKPYRNLFKVEKYLGVDVMVSGHPHKNSEIDVFYDGKILPFPNEKFDSFFCSEVFEHIFNVEEIIRELHRVLKVNGTGLITLPFAWPEHEVPYDFARYTSFGICDILERNGFSVLSSEKSGHFVECLVQLTTLYIYSLFQTEKRWLNVVCTFLFISPLNILGFCISSIAPKKTELFHNLIIVVKKR